MKPDIPPDDLAAFLKAGIDDYAIEGYGRDTNGEYTYVDWDELNRAIDELCAKFKAKGKQK